MAAAAACYRCAAAFAASFLFSTSFDTCMEGRTVTFVGGTRADGLKRFGKDLAFSPLLYFHHVTILRYRPR